MSPAEPPVEHGGPGGEDGAPRREPTAAPRSVLRLFAAARQAAGTGRVEVRAATVGDALTWARREYGGAFEAVLANSRVWCNGEPAEPDTVLADGDEVAVLPPVSGGSDTESVVPAPPGGTGRYGEEMANTPVDVLLDPGFVADLPALPMDEVRRRRDAADEVETGVSYLRRLVQGRADIVRAEQQRRAAGEAPGDLAGLVDRLPYILGDNVHAPGVGRLPTLIAPGETDPALRSRLDGILSFEALSDLPHAGDEKLTSIASELAAFERDVSMTRRSLHHVLDRLKEELVRRYRTGEANVDDLLLS